ncbi:H+transporting two-sector ATPase C subunit [Deinococcus aerius]|uniref:H+transporting two-sector ATPase C subunit n=1 Tax=Deinococcus aerius TaxID=200253 RepID=A0A2I9CZ10_9DEIO|nr:V-type ATP synthase subunit K [Deinococcus aerius]GBF07433.1 H+transporting two-sector ATPase C subunit [Deinococcus aerius]
MKKIVKYLPALTAATVASSALAQEAAAGAATGDANAAGLRAIGAGLALGLGAVGTGLAQGPIGAAAAGVVAERPEKFGQMAIWFFIPETLVIFGFVGFFLLR